MAIHKIDTVIISSMEKITPGAPPEDRGLRHLSCLANEPLSFGVAYRLNSNRAFVAGTHIKIESALPISLYSVGYVPVLQTRDTMTDDKFDPGLFGDLLLPKRTNPRIQKTSYPWEDLYLEEDKTRLFARSDSWQAVFLTVNEGERRLAAGSYPVKLTFCSINDDAPLGECELTVEVIGATLPRQTLLYTNWFHCDCLCDAYGVEPFSERFWEIFENYVKKAAENGMNTILTPAFTPPLDTPVGGERMTVQLVGVTLRDGVYSFDFSLLERFIAVSMKCGITHFEHSHLFTQWGALHAPKVMATVDGQYRRIFGWETAAAGKKYIGFLRAYLKALIAFLKERGLDRRFLYHISDEPGPKSHGDYLRAKSGVADLLEGYTLCDALSHYEFYEDGTVTTPVVVTSAVKDFLGKAKDLWVYYTGGQAKGGQPNRKLNTTGERNRMLGVQMYMCEAKGFLHWGYNYWYGPLSQGITDPRTDPGYFSGGTPGAAFIVYPATDGSCIGSIRQKVFYEAVNDMRALLRLERLIGKRATRAFVLDYFGEVSFETHLGSAERLLEFRRLLNERIHSLVTKQ